MRSLDTGVSYYSGEELAIVGIGAVYSRTHFYSHFEICLLLGHFRSVHSLEVRTAGELGWAAAVEVF